MHFFKHLLYLTLLLPLISHADNRPVVEQLQARAQQQALWKQQEWLNLLHYNNPDDGADYISQVDDPRFFNAVDGKYNPGSEMLATIRELYRDDIDGDDHAQCRFIARLEWLKKNLQLDPKTLPQVSCPKYKKWRSRIPDHKVTMVFPAYHLNSPSSMYGHTLLRLDPKEEEMGSDWLSIAVNFGADVRAEDNSMFFAFKGLTGGYPGYFIVTPYFEKIKEYNRNENRDIWEYPLNLTPEETRTLVAHLWELRNMAFDYYFFDENCSYRLLELLEVARPGVELTDEFVLTAIPVDTVRSIDREDMVVSVAYRPSQVTVLEQLLIPVPEAQHDLILRLADDISVLDSQAFQALDEMDQKRAIEIAYKYLRYLQTGTERKTGIAKQSFQLLKALNTYPTEGAAEVEQISTQPEVGHLSKRFMTLFGQDNDKNYAQLGFRMSFHSLEDNETGFLRGAQINIGDIHVRATEDDDVQLQRFDLVDIFSLTPRNRFFTPMSWRVLTGLERQLTFGQDRLVTHVTGGMGATYQPLDDNYSYALLTLRLERNRGFDDTLAPAAGIMLGTLQHFGWSTARLEVSGQRFDNDEYRIRGTYIQNFVLSRNHAIQLRAKREKQPLTQFTEWGLAYQYYF